MKGTITHCQIQFKDKIKSLILMILIIFKIYKNYAIELQHFNTKKV